MAVPVVTGVTARRTEFIVATAVLLLLHVPPGAASVNVTATPPKQITALPGMIGEPLAVTVTIVVAAQDPIE